MLPIRQSRRRYFAEDDDATLDYFRYAPLRIIS